ncbi:protein MARD1-like [Cucumis melo var. makuwa]|uniref:Protein MARD1-like n=1 Tax=Cucumis melo var. makuwa TaxID=1194695 RepID=A0A5D3DT83_CUCMM|nr:protein MARD1-like [Cucumis melo var. makuwa]TYK26545.1 protein MARD1-like [Cucumis melo var. makuwa]
MPPPNWLPIKRTTSQKEILFDVGGAAVSELDNPTASSLFDHRLLSMLSPRNNRRHSDEFPWSSHHLRAFCLCQRRLLAGRDIYMYKGESAFCSAECRQQQMNQDEAKEKCLTASKKGSTAIASAPTTVTKVSAINGETVAAV